jgi:hypothetical protein
LASRSSFADRILMAKPGTRDAGASLPVWRRSAAPFPRSGFPFHGPARPS